MTKEEYKAKRDASANAGFTAIATYINDSMIKDEYIESLEAENATLTLLHTQATDEMLKMQNRVHKLEAEIAQLQADNRSLVEQMNAMALKPNQAVIEYFYPKYNPENRRIENLPTEECPCIVELYSGEYDIVWWIDGGFEETGWDGYCVDDVKSWAYLPKGVKRG